MNECAGVKCCQISRQGHLYYFYTFFTSKSALNFTLTETERVLYPNAQDESSQGFSQMPNDLYYLDLILFSPSEQGLLHVFCVNLPMHGLRLKCHLLVKIVVTGIL